MYEARIPIIKELEDARKSKVIIYVTGDRPPNFQTQIHPEVIDFFADHLDRFETTDKISLYLYSEGGITLAGWSIVNLIRQYCNELEVIIPRKAHSTATLIAIGANSIVMTKQATLGPVDPSVNGPLNPINPAHQIPGQPLTVPISVEAVISFGQLARDEFGLNDNELERIYLKLSDMVHPLALGEVYRARTQIKMLAGKLLDHHMKDKSIKEKIIAFLCSESGSHDYTINKREAQELGLPIVEPSVSEYNIIKRLYDDIKLELKLKEPFNPIIELGEVDEKNYSVARCLIESAYSGSHKFFTHGLLRRSGLIGGSGQVNVPQVIDLRLQEGWEHERIQ